MQLVHVLAAGVRGAEQGTARLYNRGTSTPATLYADFEGTSVDPSGTVTLDSSGRATTYVNRVVDVVVIDEDGATVGTFTCGESAPSVEYQGAGFTGTNYTSGASGAGSGYPVTLQAVLDLARTAFGATDWRIPVGSSSNVGIGEAVRAFYGVLYNVRAPTFGAEGDGTTDDATAIAAAIAACSAAGGGIVFFPAGTYRITSELAIPNNVSLWGAGANAVAILVDHASANAINFSGATAYYSQELAGMRISAQQSNSGSCVVVGANAKVVLRDLTLGGALNTGTILSSTGLLFANGLNLSIATTSISSMVSAAAGGFFEECIFTCPATYSPTNGAVAGNSLFMRNCSWDSSATTVGLLIYLVCGPTTVIGQLSGCIFGPNSTATVTAISIGTYDSSSIFSEEGSIFGAGIIAYNYVCAAASAGAQVQLKTRRNRRTTYTITGSTATLPVKQYGHVSVTNTNAGNSNIVFDGKPPEGDGGAVIVLNSDGSGRDFSITETGAVASTVKTIGAGAANGFLYEILTVGGAVGVVPTWAV